MKESAGPGYREFKVVRRVARGHTVDLVSGDGQTITLHRFAPVGKNDSLITDGGNVATRLESGQVVPLTPAWERVSEIDIEPPLKVVVKEIETAEELSGYDSLTQFHYRGTGGAGRRVPLIAVVHHWELPQIVGFIELTSTFLVNTARARLFDAHFSDAESGIAWATWDSATTRRYSNVVVRISRCVVYPELRGIGLSKILVDAAVEYARERWHIGGMRPLFIEITAEMLRYWPFVSKSGFTYIGDTEGNRHRAAKDMKYLLSRKLAETPMPRGGGGILSAQRSYATTLARVIHNSGHSVEDIVNFLHRAPESLSDDEWVQLHKVYRRPKPTYIRGLTTAATEFVKRRSGLLHEKRAGTTSGPKPLRQCGVSAGKTPAFTVSGLSVTVSATPTSSARARRVQEAFGIVAKRFESMIIKPFDFSLEAGEVAFITGPSGSGKSLLMKALRYLISARNQRGRLPAAVGVGGVASTVPVRIGWHRPVDARKSPIELLASHSVEEALQALAMAGLAEAQLFVRPAHTLSVGQRYRLGIALAMATRPSVLFIDEFCEPLDRFTALAVSKQIRGASRKFGMAVVVASADARRVMSTLQPEKVLRLSWNGDIGMLSDWRQTSS